MIFKKLFKRFSHLSEYIIYSVPSLDLKQDKVINKYKELTKMTLKDLVRDPEFIEFLVPPNKRQYPSYVDAYITAFLRDTRTFFYTLKLLDFHYSKTIHKKEYKYVEFKSQISSCSEICDIEIDTLKRIKFDFHYKLKLPRSRKLKKKPLKSHIFLKHNNFYKSYVEFHKNLYFYKKFNYETTFSPLATNLFLKLGSKYSFQRAKSLIIRNRTYLYKLISKFNLKRLKLERLELKKLITSKYNRRVFRRPDTINFETIIPPLLLSQNLFGDNLVRQLIINNKFKESLGVTYIERQLDNERFDDAYSYQTYIKDFEVDNAVNRFFNIPKDYINILNHKVKLVNGLTSLSFLNINNKLDLYFLDINSINNVYNLQKFLQIYPNIKDIVNFYKSNFNKDFYEYLIFFNKTLGIERKILINNFIKTITNVNIYTYIQPSVYNLKEIKIMSLEEKALLLNQLKFFKFLRNDDRYKMFTFSPLPYYKNLTIELDKLLKSKLNYLNSDNRRTFLSAPSIFLSLIKYISLLNLKFYDIKFFLYKLFGYIQLKKTIYITNINVCFNKILGRNFDISNNIIINNISKLIYNTYLFITYITSVFKTIFIKIFMKLIKLIKLPHLLIYFSLKSIIYIFIFILQLFLPFSYIIIDIIIKYFNKLFLKYKSDYAFFKFTNSNLTFINLLKNKLYLGEESIISFKLYKELITSFSLRKKIVKNNLILFNFLNKLNFNNLIDYIKQKDVYIDYNLVKKNHPYETNYEIYCYNLKNSIKYSLTNSNVQEFIEKSSMKTYLGELYLPNKIPTLEVIKIKLFYEDLNYIEKFFFIISRNFFYRNIFLFFSTLKSVKLINFIKILFNKISNLFFINRVEFNEFGIDFFDYSITNDSLFALQEYLTLTTNYSNAKRVFKIYHKILKIKLTIRELFYDQVDNIKNLINLIISFFSNSEYRFFLNKLFSVAFVCIYDASKEFYYYAKPKVKEYFWFLVDFILLFGWVIALYREIRLILFLIVQGYYASPSRPLMDLDDPLRSNFFGIRTFFEVYADIVESVIFTYLLRGGLRFDIFVENHPVFVGFVVLFYKLFIYLTRPRRVVSFFSCYFLAKFFYERITFYFFYLPLFRRIRVTENFNFICDSKDKLAIEFAKYVHYNHERVITYSRWFKWVHFDKPKIYFRKFLLIFLNFLLILTRKFLFPEIYGLTIVLLERINKLSKIIIIFSNIINKIDDLAWNFFDFMNKFIYVKLPSNFVYHWQCYTIEYRGIFKLIFYTPFYIIIIFLQLFFIFINVIILFFPLIIVILDTLIEMYYNYLKELLNLSLFANYKEHFDKYNSPRFNNIYRSHRKRLSESLRFKNDMFLFVNCRRRVVRYQDKYKYFPDFYSKKRDFVYKCNLNLGYKRDKQIMRIRFIKDNFNLNKAFIGKIYRYRMTPEWFEQKYNLKTNYEYFRFSKLYPTSRFFPRYLGQYGSKFNRPTTSSPLELPNRYNHYMIITNNIPRSLYHYIPNYWFDREIDDMVDDDFESSSLDLFDTMEPNEERYIALSYKRDICASGFYESMEMEEETFWAEYTFLTLYRSVNNFLVKKETESIKDLLPIDRIFDFYYDETYGRYYDTYGNEVMIENFELKYNVSDYFDWRFPEGLADVACGTFYDYNEENRYFDIKWNNLKVKLNTIYGYSDDTNKKILIANSLLTYLELKDIPNFKDPEILKEFNSLRRHFNFTLTKELIDSQKTRLYKKLDEEKNYLKQQKLLEIKDFYKNDFSKLKNEKNKIKRYNRMKKKEQIDKKYKKFFKYLKAEIDHLDLSTKYNFSDEEEVKVEEILENYEKEFKDYAKIIGIEIVGDPHSFRDQILIQRHNLRKDLEHRIKRIIEKIVSLQEDYLNSINMKQRNNFKTTESAIKKIYREEEVLRIKVFKQHRKDKKRLPLKYMKPLTEDSISSIKNFCSAMFKTEFNKNITELRSQLNMAKFQLKCLECDILLDGLNYKYEHVVKTLKDLRFIKKNNLFKSKDIEENAISLIRNLNINLNKDKLRLSKKINNIKKVRTYSFVYRNFNLWFCGFSYTHSIYVSCLDNGVFTWPYGHIQVGALEDWGNWYFRYAFYLGFESFHMPDGEYYEHEEDEDDEDEDNEETEDFDDETDGDCDPWYIDGWDMDEQIDTEDILGWLHECFYEDDIEKGGFKVRDNERRYYFKENRKIYFMELIVNLKKAAKTLLEDPNRSREELNLYEMMVLDHELSTNNGILKIANLKNKPIKEQNYEMRRVLKLAKKYVYGRRLYNYRILNKLYRQSIYKIDDFRRLDKVYIPKGYWDRERDKENYKEYARNRKLQLDMAYKKGEIMFHRESFINLQHRGITNYKAHYFLDYFYHEYYLMYKIYRRKVFTYTETFTIKPFMKLFAILLKEYPNDHEKIKEDFFKYIDLVYEAKVSARNHGKYYVTIFEKRSSENLFILDPEEVKAEAEYVKNRDEGKYLF